jgi:hypothetical protein
MAVIVLSNMESAIFWSTERGMNGSVSVLIAVRAMIMSHMERRKESK